MSRIREPNTMGVQPKLQFWQIWNMCFGFMGIQFGFALQNANVSRIFQTLGADYSNMTVLWLAAPITGLLVQPIVGYFSDRTWGPLGRRRPYFLYGAIAASLALVQCQILLSFGLQQAYFGFLTPQLTFLWNRSGHL